jgi:hypothetical protein
VLLFPAAILLVGGLQGRNPRCASCGAQIAITLWIIGIAAHQPVLWSSKVVPRFRGLAIWSASTVIGLLAYVGLEFGAAMLVASGAAIVGLLTGPVANLCGTVAASGVAALLMRWRVSDAGEPVLAPKKGTIVTACVLVAVVGAALGFSALDASNGSAPLAIPATLPSVNPYLMVPTGLGGYPPEVITSLDAIIAEYQENEFAAAAKYETPAENRVSCLLGTDDACRVIQLSAVLSDMGRDDRSMWYLRLSTTKSTGIKAHVDGAPPEALQALKRGQTVRLRCSVQGPGDSSRFTLRRCGVAGYLPGSR